MCNFSFYILANTAVYFWLTPGLSEAEQCDSRQKKAELSQNNKQIFFFNAVQMVHTLFLHESDIYFLKEDRVGGGRPKSFT